MQSFRTTFVAVKERPLDFKSERGGIDGNIPNPKWIKKKVLQMIQKYSKSRVSPYILVLNVEKTSHFLSNAFMSESLFE